ncbi:MAG TPA: thiamine pyrophosphate-dependent dehydrogenase E1 component subunit alpha [Candidatus Dormibacteraeota bacterium]|nr:thiamine pyrophosphate-dependent dehydrogenase E1 component subunit alpha [Candidatus Dormibacteraeota bacterium]
MLPTREQKLWMYERMVASRYFEDTIEAIYLEGKTPVFNMASGPIPGEMHLSKGQEPCAAGVCIHLKPTDVVTSTHRAHHVAIAKGVDLDKMAAEIFGKGDGLSGGRGGHMHLFDPAVNFSCSGIIGQSVGPAVGAALSRKLQSKDGVAVAYLGEGAANQGAFHEALNLAAIWKLPVIFVIEDNSWAISVPKSASTPVEHNDVRAIGYGIPGHYVANNDVLQVFKVAGQAIERARNGEGPSLIEIETLRLSGHFMGDAQQYRPKEELEMLAARDPIPAYRGYLTTVDALTPQEDAEIVTRARKRVDDAIAFARRSPYPEPAAALDKVFV